MSDRHAAGRHSLPPGEAALRARLAPLAALQPAARTSVLFPRPAYRERRPGDVTELVTVGRVGRPHGVDGSFFVEQSSDAPERFAKGATLLVEGEPAEVVGSKRGAGGRFVIRLDRPVPRGATLAVRRDELPEPADDSYYVFQLVGLAVEEEGGRSLGAVADVENGPANDALVLDSGVLLPLVESCVLEVDLAAGRILVARGFADAE